MEINFKKKFGQNFLSDGNLLTSIVADSCIDENTTVVEVGAGAGALTQKLAQKAKQVFAFEIDTELKPILEEKLKDYSNCKVVFKDFLTVSNEELESLVGNKFCVVANLPYYITSPLITKFLTCGLDVGSLTVMVQAEVGDRIVAKPKTKDYGVLSIMVQLCGNAVITRKVGRQMFTPAPNVDSCIVYLKVDKVPANYLEIVEFVKKAFASRRKTLLNNLSSFSKDTVASALKQMGVPENSRAEELSANDFVSLYKILANKV